MFKSVLVVGPTGSGKTALAEKFAREKELEIINCDSVQAYKGFDIGTSKPLNSDIKYHLLSCFDPSQRLDAFAYASEAYKISSEIVSNKKLAFFCGGSGLYVNAVVQGSINYAKPAPEAVKQLEQIEDHKEALRAYTSELPEDERRIERLLLHHLSGCPTSTQKSLVDLGPVLVVVLLPERQSLYRRINSRAEEMFENGLLDEARGLLELYGEKAVPFESIGYRHALMILNGEVSEDEGLSILQRDTRRLAKRQLTWWRNQPKKYGWQEVDDLRECINWTTFYKTFECLVPNKSFPVNYLKLNMSFQSADV